MSTETLKQLAGQAEIDLSGRPQDLTVEDFTRFSRLYRSMEQRSGAGA